MKDLIARTRQLFAEGMPLADTVDSALRVDLELFSRGGLAVLDAIEAIGYNTLESRPSIPKSKQLRLLLRALAQRTFSFGRPSVSRVPIPPRPIAIVEGGCVQPGFKEPPELARLADGVRSGVTASYSECRRIARAAASNFYYAFFMLPQAKRDALCALYAFMRLVDDVSDSVGSVADKQRGLARWRAALDAAIAGDLSAHPILPAFADTIQRFRIPPRYFHDLISGAEMDLTVGEYATFDRLREYCYRVAGTVGLTCLHVFGFDDPHAPDLAEKLGIAFQMTNILRDIPKDYEMGRVYLPLEDLAQFGVRREELARGPLTPQMRKLLELEAARAWGFYQEGVQLIPLVHRDAAPRCGLWRASTAACCAASRSAGLMCSPDACASALPRKPEFSCARGSAGILKTHVLEERDRDRRRPGGTVLGRRAG